MLTRPDIHDEEIGNCLTTAYGLAVQEIKFLPIGADLNTAVFRVTSIQQNDYFLKIRRGSFSGASVRVPFALFRSGLRQVIPPLTTKTHRLSFRLGGYQLVLYPFVEGKNGFETPLSAHQWIEFGIAMRRLHRSKIPTQITSRLPRETFSNDHRRSVVRIMNSLSEKSSIDVIATETAAFLHSKTPEITELITRAEDLAVKSSAESREFILCHGDIHGWNLLIDPNGDFYIVDWDTLIFAPQERDLMFIGGGLSGNAFSPIDEESLFYSGYGQVKRDFDMISYYRYERIIEDIAAFSDQLFLKDAAIEDRRQSLVFLQSIFKPGGVLKIADEAFKS